MADEGRPPHGKLRRLLAVGLVLLGVLTFIVAALGLLLTAHRHDFCDSTCNEGSAHVWAGLSAIAALSSLVQIVAAANRSWRVALGALGLNCLVLGIPILLVIAFS